MFYLQTAFSAMRTIRGPKNLVSNTITHLQIGSRKRLPYYSKKSFKNYK